MRHLLLLPLVTAAISLPTSAQQPVPQAVPVVTFIAQARPVSETKGYVGRIEAVERVEIRARVTGYLEAVLYKEGDIVKKGQPLYRIEQDLFKAAVEQTQGSLDGAKASKKLTKAELERATQMMASSYGTPQKRDQALAADENAAANILIAQANLDTAKINLGYTDITSPIDGKIGRTNITKGNVVSPNSGVLTTVVSQDPMYVIFPVSQRDFLEVHQEGGMADASNLEVTVQFSDGRFTTIRAPSILSMSPSTIDRHRFGARDDPQSRRRPCRWPVRACEHRHHQTAGKNRHPAGGAPCRPAGNLCLCCRGWQSRGPKGHAWRRAWHQHRHRTPA